MNAQSNSRLEPTARQVFKLARIDVHLDRVAAATVSGYPLKTVVLHPASTRMENGSIES
jgi:hypothetical protein